MLTSTPVCVSVFSLEKIDGALEFVTVDSIADGIQILADDPTGVPTTQTDTFFVQSNSNIHTRTKGFCVKAAKQRGHQKNKKAPTGK